MKRLSLFLLLLMLLVAFLLLPAVSIAQAENSNPFLQTEPVVTEEPTVSTVPVVVTVQPVSDSTDRDWSNLRELVMVLGVLALGVIGVLRGGNPLEAAGKLLDKVNSSHLLTDRATTQFNHLPPETRAKIATLIDVVDPLTKTTAADIDDRVLAWFRVVTATKPNAGSDTP